jgi:hypothetical protein
MSQSRLSVAVVVLHAGVDVQEKLVVKTSTLGQAELLLALISPGTCYLLVLPLALDGLLLLVPSFAVPRTS